MERKKRVNLIDAKRGQNAAIALARLKNVYEDVLRKEEVDEGNTKFSYELVKQSIIDMEGKHIHAHTYTYTD